MAIYLIKRFASAIVLLLLVTTATFAVMYASSENVVRSLVGENASAEQLAQRTTELGLDRPLWEQFVGWASKAITGDFGVSYFTSEPVVVAVTNRLPVTLSLVIVSMIILSIVSAVLGTLAAVRTGGALDRTLQIVTEVFSSVPKFWLALMLVIAFALTLPLFPATGFVPLTEDPVAWMICLVLPVAAIVLGELRVTSMVRGAVADELSKDYVRTLRSRGLSASEILFRNALRNAAPPWLTLMSMKFVALLGGTLVIEKVFALPGLGSLATNAALSGDVPVLLGVVVATVLIIVVVYLVFDLVQSWLNPKVRLQ
jgi:peptide/nickel transport system permease protein